MREVRPGRVSIIAGVLVAIFVGAAFCKRTVPDAVVSLVGGPDGGIARLGGLRLRFTPAAGTDPRYLRELAETMSVARVGDAFVLEFPGVAEDMAMDLAEILASGGLRMHEVLETDYARKIGPSDEVEVEDDYWQADDGSDHTNAYLRGPSPEALDRAITAAKQRGWQPAPNTTILYERVEPWPDAERPEPYWRTYEVVAQAEIDGSMIADARSSYDPYSNRPIVLLDFTREGGRKFGDLTERISGRKMATVLGTRVYSVPVINGPIRGGRASITMGGSKPERQEREARMLAEVLRKGSLPVTGKVDASQWSPPPDISTYEWLGRIVLGAIAGLGFGLVAFVTVKLTRPRWGARPVLPDGGGTFPWRRVAVTALAPLALVVGSHILIPGVNGDDLEQLIPGGDTTHFSVLALSITPVMIAFFLVELVALAIPPLRWRRHDPVGRARLGQAVAALAILLALVQAYFLTAQIESYGRMGAFGGAFGYGDSAVVPDPGLQFRLVATASLVSGTLVLVIIAGMIREHGLGNGYGVMFLSGSVLEFLHAYVAEPEATPEILARDALGLVTVAVIGVIAAALLRWRVASREREPALRVPSSGFSPLGDSLALFYLFAMISMIGLGTELSVAMGRVTELQSRTSVIFGLVVVTVPLWSWLFARPRLSGVTLDTWVRGTALSLVMLLAIAAIQWFAMRTDAGTAGLAHAISIMIGAAVLLDIRDDLRAHRQPLAPVAVLHQIQRAGRVERILTDAGIPFHIHAAHLRTLYAFFGPFAPAIVLVPEVHAIEARGKLADAMEPPVLPPATALKTESPASTPVA